jgi:hypothetical protein
VTSWLPLPSRRAESDPEHTTFVDPTRDLAVVRSRWEVRSAEWRAVALAEAIFGRPVGVRLQGVRPPPPRASRGIGFRGLLRLEVPFDELDLHRWRESVFQACAAEDPVLCRVPLVYVFAPAPRDRSPRGAPDLGAPERSG